MNEKNADFIAEAGQPAGERSSESGSMDIFIAELGRLKRITAGMGLSASDADDVLQDVSIKALKWTGNYQSRGQNVRWLTKVTVNRCLTEHRHRRSFRRRASEILKRRPETKTESTAEKVIAAEELEIVRKSLQELDETLLTPLVLRYFCDLNSRQIGEILALSPSVVRNRLREARMILARRLVKKGVEP